MNMFPMQAIPKLVNVIRGVVSMTKLAEYVYEQVVWVDMKPLWKAAPEWNQLNICCWRRLRTQNRISSRPSSPPTCTAGSGGRRLTTTLRFISRANWIFSDIKWRTHLVPRTVSQRGLKHDPPFASYQDFFWIVCARFWTWRTPLWDGGGGFVWRCVR